MHDVIHDVIVVGARCAGAPLAMLLARRGYRVLLLDRATFPSDTISGHCVLHRGTVRLRRWGLLDAVLASNSPPISRLSSTFDDFTLSGEVPAIDDAPACLGPRRTVLDTILVEAAVAAGAELRQEFVVTGLLSDGDRVTGVRGHGPDGREVGERARLVIGADGKHSRIAKLVGAAVTHAVPSLTCWYMTYWDDFPGDALEIAWRPGRLVLTMPTNDGVTLVAVAWPRAEFPRFRADIERNFVDTVRRMPTLAERVPAVRRVEPYAGMAEVPGFFRQAHGPGWALVGDAGHHKDPTPAYGISDAFCDAELLAAAVDDGLSGRVPLATALSGYERQRNERAMPDHELTCQRATLAGWDAPPMRQLRDRVRGDAAATGLYHAVLAKALPPEALRAL